MSLFKTSIPIPANDVVDRLPQRSYVDSAKLSPDRKTVDIVWGCDDLKTGFTFPVEIPLEDILSGAFAEKYAAKPKTLASPRPAPATVPLPPLRPVTKPAPKPILGRSRK